jgi:hypothetical protein
MSVSAPIALIGLADQGQGSAGNPEWTTGPSFDMKRQAGGQEVGCFMALLAQPLES